MLLNLLASAMLVASSGAAGFADVPARPYFDGSPSVLRADSSVDPNIDFTGLELTFNETLDFTSLPEQADPYSLVISFSSGDVPCRVFTVRHNGTQLAMTFSTTEYTSIYAYNASDGGWGSDVSRSITFNADVTNQHIRAFLIDNCEFPEEPSLGEQITDIVGTGLGFVVNLGSALNSGFDAIFMDNDALTNVGAFAFVLLGLGISVGITKKCFNWITGRHGM